MKLIRTDYTFLFGFFLMLGVFIFWPRNFDVGTMGAAFLLAPFVLLALVFMVFGILARVYKSIKDSRFRQSSQLSIAALELIALAALASTFLFG